MQFKETPLPGDGTYENAKSLLDELTSSPLTQDGIGEKSTADLLDRGILPALPNQSRNYYGFVTGSVTPAARDAEISGAMADANAAAVLPHESIAVDVEDTALQFLLDFLDLDRKQWPGRILTTGATASNLLGMALGRQYVVGPQNDVADLGLVKAMHNAGVSDIKVLSSMCHSSLIKTLSIVGLGRSSVVQLSDPQAPWDFHLGHLEAELEKLSQVSAKAIVTANFGEVNTGGFTSHIPEIRKLCDKYGAWLHVDGAFAVYLRLLAKQDSTSKYKTLSRQLTQHLELADSITCDAHKTLNVPYDCGIFFTKHASLMRQVFQNGTAAYLNTSEDAPVSHEIVSSGLEFSPMNTGIENSRRFRGLPVLATLLAYGTSGYSRFLENVIDVSRLVAEYIDASPHYELLVPLSIVNTIVIFRAKDDNINKNLKTRINSLNKIYVSPSAWNGKPAVRIAPCSWYLNVGKDVELIRQVLESVVTA